MRDITKTLGATILAFTFGCEAIAATGTGTANARVVTPIAITATRALEFGSFTSATSQGTVTVENENVRNKTGSIVLMSSTPAAATGKFTVSGQASTPYTFTISQSNITLNRSGGGNMQAAISLQSGGSSRTIGSGGSEVVEIKGTLTVQANQTAGSYTGTYTVTADY